MSTLVPGTGRKQYCDSCLVRGVLLPALTTISPGFVTSCRLREIRATQRRRLSVANILFKKCGELGHIYGSRIHRRLRITGIILE
jgi:hypothetical protein